MLLCNPRLSSKTLIGILLIFYMFSMLLTMTLFSSTVCDQLRFVSFQYAKSPPTATEVCLLCVYRDLSILCFKNRKQVYVHVLIGALPIFCLCIQRSTVNHMSCVLDRNHGCVECAPHSPSLIPRLLCGGGGKRAWYTLFTHAPHSLGNLHTIPLH